MDLITKLEELRGTAKSEIDSASNAEDLESLRIKYLGRQGQLPGLLSQLGTVSKEDKPRVGKLANEVKQVIEEAFNSAKERLESETAAAAFANVDVTLPGRIRTLGKLHPLTQVVDEMVAIFRRIGFAVADGPDIETDYYNFDALNTPADHPARKEQDTFYLGNSQEGRLLLRTQTSPVQIRVMEKQAPPIRIIAPGSCYRRDNPDATHSIMFHQIEGLYVDREVSVADLKGTLEFFFRELLGKNTKIRLRPHFFPFTEPSFEVDVDASALGRKDKQWLEIAGCGMVDPNVFAAVEKKRRMGDYDPEKITGFAFGLGIERIAMVLNGVRDIRLFYENDLRFLRQF